MINLRFSKSDDEKTLYLLKGDIDEEWYGDRYVESHFTSYDKPIKCDLHEFINTSSSEIEHILFAFLRGQDEKYRKMSEEKARNIIFKIKENINNPFRHFTIGDDCEVEL